jgi:hypothetical protein
LVSDCFIFQCFGQQRENFMGSYKIEPVDGDTNRGCIDANVFENVTWVK